MTRHTVLNTRIPLGGFGRHLTSSECRALRAAGVSCSPRWIVVRQLSGSATLGICYYPVARGTGYMHAGVYVETRE